MNRQTVQQQAEFVAKGVPVTRFPNLYARIEEEQQKHRQANNGSGMQLMQMLQRLGDLARMNHRSYGNRTTSRRINRKADSIVQSSKTPWRGNFGANKKAATPYNQQRLSYLGAAEEDDSAMERGQETPDDDQLQHYIKEMVSHPSISTAERSSRDGYVP